eukprot:2160129-Rhodomonas_salina.1
MCIRDSPPRDRPVPTTSFLSFWGCFFSLVFLSGRAWGVQYRSTKGDAQYGVCSTEARRGMHSTERGCVARGTLQTQIQEATLLGSERGGHVGAGTAAFPPLEEHPDPGLTPIRERERGTELAHGRECGTELAYGAAATALRARRLLST